MVSFFFGFLPLFWWMDSQYGSNFGDALSPVIVQKIIQRQIIKSSKNRASLLAIGSILHYAKNDDVIWGTGMNGKISVYMHNFSRLDVRAVRGPLTRHFLLSRGIACPEIYGDPALLLPRLFPELKVHPKKEYIVIPNKNEIKQYSGFPNLVLPTWDIWKIIDEILQAKLVISGSLHGIIVAEAFGIPAILLRLTQVEPLFKYEDYYFGTGRDHFKIAYSIEDALKMGGESSHL